MTTSRFVFSVALFLSACQATPQAASQADTPPPLTVAELKMVTANKSYDVKPVRGESSVISYRDTGTVTLSGALNDSGKYRFGDSMLCTTWTKIRDGKEACQTFHSLPSGQIKILNLDKSENSVLTPRP